MLLKRGVENSRRKMVRMDKLRDTGISKQKETDQIRRTDDKRLLKPGGEADRAGGVSLRTAHGISSSKGTEVAACISAGAPGLCADRGEITVAEMD